MYRSNGMSAGLPSVGASIRWWTGHITQARLHWPTGSIWMKAGSGGAACNGRASAASDSDDESLCFEGSLIGGDPHGRSMGCYCPLHCLWNVACHKKRAPLSFENEAGRRGVPPDCKSTMASAIVLRRGAIADRKKAPLSFKSGAFQNLQFLHCSHNVSAMCSTFPLQALRFTILGAMTVSYGEVP